MSHITQEKTRDGIIIWGGGGLKEKDKTFANTWERLHNLERKKRLWLHPNCHQRWADSLCFPEGKEPVVGSRKLLCSLFIVFSLADCNRIVSLLMRISLQISFQLVLYSNNIFCLLAVLSHFNQNTLLIFNDTRT